MYRDPTLVGVCAGMDDLVARVARADGWDCRVAIYCDPVRQRYYPARNGASGMNDRVGKRRSLGEARLCVTPRGAQRNVG